MSSPRADFTATLLRNGKVLLVGGRASAGTFVANAELFDPVTNTFTAAASAAVARSGHSATLLPNGKVLVAGGSSAPGTGGLISAELYDPGLNQWTPASSMNSVHTQHTATLLTDGRVLVAGGADADAAAKAELYYPAKDCWVNAGSMQIQRPGRATATLLPNGNVLVVGGELVPSTDSATSQTNELFNPATGAWSMVGGSFDRGAPGARNYHTATMLPNGTLLVAGGSYFVGTADPLSTADLYDPTSSRWSTAPDMTSARCGHTATLLQDGRVLVAGGRCGIGKPVAASELYDPATGTWASAGNLQDARGLHTAILLNDGRVLVSGGTLADGTVTNNAEIYTPS